MDDGALSPSTSAETMEFNILLAKTVFSKWSPEIFALLYMGRPMGFEEIRKAIGAISPQVLSGKLKQMEETGVVERKVLDTKPPRVQYSLTPHGWKIMLLQQPIVQYLRLTMDEGVLRRLAGPDTPLPDRLPTLSEHRGLIAKIVNGSDDRG